MNCEKVLKYNILSKLGWPALLALLIIQFVIVWFFLNWIWPEVKFWHYILLLPLLCVLVISVSWFEGISRRRKHRAFIRRLGKVSTDFAKLYDMSLEIDEHFGAITFCFEHPSEGQCRISLQRYGREKPMLTATLVFNHKDIAISETTRVERKELVSLEEEYISNVLVRIFEDILSWQRIQENKEDEIVNSIDMESLPGPKRSGLVYYRDEIVWSPNHKYFALAYSICEVTMGNEVGIASWGTVQNGKARIVRTSMPFSIWGNHRPWCKWLNDEVFICKASRYNDNTLYVPLVAIDVHRGFRVIPETNILALWFDDIEKVDGEFQPFDELELAKEIEKTGQK
jgi:hypothetical protein